MFGYFTLLWLYHCGDDVQSFLFFVGAILGGLGIFEGFAGDNKGDLHWSRLGFAFMGAGLFLLTLSVIMPNRSMARALLYQFYPQLGF